MTDDQIDWGRLRAARRGSKRFFSGSRPATVQERLTALAVDGLQVADPNHRTSPSTARSGNPVGHPRDFVSE
ncbi:hypothetical protein ABZW30_03995 [Kitasatospora sp. NPDC004669]|uniref:hypothetical protein n=1 Tax=Kitasatospora sp. NPDC004669 TaxID=3154555 RepID=UPI0033A81139